MFPANLTRSGQSHDDIIHCSRVTTDTLTDKDTRLLVGQRSHKAGARGPRCSALLSLGPCNYSNSVEAGSVEREALIPTVC